MGGLDVIMTSDFYQAHHVRNSWIFKPITNTFNTIALNYWLEYVQCYELQEMMWQDDINFINILNRFQIASQKIEDIKFMKNNFLKTPPMNNTLPYLCYINVKTIMHNKNVFWNIFSQTFTFLTCDVHIETCPSHFKLSNLRFQNIDLRCEILVKKKMLVELCVGNYETSNDLENGVVGIFEEKQFENL